MPATAIDIGTSSIKAISGKPGKNPVINRVVEIPNTSGVSIPKDNNQAGKLLEVVSQLIHDYKLPKTDVRLSLPEEIISTKVINLPPLSDAELASAIDWQAEQHIPIPLDQLALEYQVLYRPPAKQKDQPMKVLLVGARNNIIEEYVNIFFNLGIQPTILETQIFSVMRALDFTVDDPTSIIVHMGANNIQLAVVHQTEIGLATNKKGGGELLTKAVQQVVSNLTIEQAEEYKKAYGLMTDQLQGKIRDAMLPALNPIGQEIVKTIRFYNNEQPNANISRIVLTGGLAQMPGIIEYFTQLTGIEALLAEPFATSSGTIPEENHQAFIVCCGLMMR
jgi:type IV pilus assembly protein PilM